MMDVLQSVDEWLRQECEEHRMVLLKIQFKSENDNDDDDDDEYERKWLAVHRVNRSPCILLVSPQGKIIQVGCWTMMDDGWWWMMDDE